MSTDSSSHPAFSDLGLAAPVLQALNGVGYETPSPIQAMVIPHILAGRDVVGQAQTGTGKTAAFALPLLSRINLNKVSPQVLVLTPTRELAIQVAEAFQRYAAHMKGFHVLPVYGGQEYGVQLRQLKRGVHVVVGTPGRVMDHIRRSTLKLDGLICLVLDEGDEMLRMGFIDDVEWILEQSPSQHQVALFSATMPDPIRKISKKYLTDPEQITIKTRTSTVEKTRQSYLLVHGNQKLDALTRILEATTYNGILIFVRTKIETVELAEKLEARGYACAALNGDITQKMRELTVNKFKSGKLDILVATDVAARGLDVERISHVINYDIPNDTEAYVHRIGRTGRAGRTGEAILFVTPRERHMLQSIERATRQHIEPANLPTTESINNERITRFKQRISETLANEELGLFNTILEQFQQETNLPPLDIAAALAKLLQGDVPLLVDKNIHVEHSEVKKDRTEKHRDREKRFSKDSKVDQKNKHKPKTEKQYSGNRMLPEPDEDMERYRLEVGSKHEVKAGNIVGAIANEAGLDSSYIRRVTIYDTYSTVDLPAGMPKDVFRDLKKTWVASRQLNITRLGEDPGQKNLKKDRKNKGKPEHRHKHKKNQTGKPGKH
jgi:ATP-dependent RNA helicase DeaD